MEMRRITLRRKNLNAKGNGVQETRRIRLPDGLRGWASDLAENVTGHWSSETYLAADRTAKQNGDVPVGTIVLAFDSPFRGGQKSGKATLTAGIVVSEEEGLRLAAERGKTEGKIVVEWGLDTRSRDGEWEVRHNGEWVRV